MAAVESKRRGSVSANLTGTQTQLEPIAPPWNLTNPASREEMFTALGEALRDQKITFDHKKDFKDPINPAIITTVFAGLVKRPLHADWDFTTPSFDGGPFLQSAPHLFEEIVPEINLVQTILKMCHAAGQPRASYGDILKPCRATALPLLASVTNYLRFAEDFQQLQKSEEQKREQMAQARDEGEQEIKALEGTMAEVRGEHDARGLVCTQVDEENARLAEKLRVIDNEHKQVTIDAEKQKKNIQAEKAALTEQKLALQNALAEIHSLQQLIVPDPEKILKDTADMEAQLVIGTAEVEEHNGRLRDNQARLALLQRHEKKIDARIATMREFSALLRTQEIEENKVKQFASETAGEEEKLKMYHDEEMDDRSEFEKLQAKLAANSTEFQAKRAIGRQRGTSAMERKTVAEQVAAKERQRVDKITADTASRARDMAETSARLRQVISDGNVRYEQLQKQVMYYHHMMMDALTRAGVSVDSNTGTMTVNLTQTLIGTTPGSASTPTTTTSSTSASTSSSHAASYVTPPSLAIAASTPIISSKTSLYASYVTSGAPATVAAFTMEHDEKRAMPFAV